MKSILCYLLSLCFTFSCLAKSILIIDSETKEVWTISDKDDTIIPNGKEMIILEESLDELAFSDNPTNYFYKNGKFIKNIDKINEAESKRDEYRKIKEEEKLIQERMRKIAIDQLKEEGHEFKYN